MAAASIAQLLHKESIDAVEARALLRTVLHVSDAHLAAHPEQTLTDHQRDSYMTLVQRRRAGEPIAYLTGEREFYGLAFKVTPAVLIPRPETELLVELALERIPPAAGARVLDLGTGSGCLAIAIARERPRAEIVAVDASAEAVALARVNADRHAAPNVTLLNGDWFAAVPGQRFDVIIANPPYVPAGDPHLAQGDLRFEPRAALVAGADGLDCIGLIVAQARAHLVAGGWFLFEHGFDQATRCRSLLSAAGLKGVFTRRDLAGIERVSGGAA